MLPSSLCCLAHFVVYFTQPACRQKGTPAPYIFLIPVVAYPCSKPGRIIPAKDTLKDTIDVAQLNMLPSSLSQSASMEGVPGHLMHPSPLLHGQASKHQQPGAAPGLFTRASLVSMTSSWRGTVYTSHCQVCLSLVTSQVLGLHSHSHFIHLVFHYSSVNYLNQPCSGYLY